MFVFVVVCFFWGRGVVIFCFVCLLFCVGGGGVWLWFFVVFCLVFLVVVVFVWGVLCVVFCLVFTLFVSIHFCLFKMSVFLYLVFFCLF